MNNTVTRALGFISRHKRAASGAALVLAVVLVFALVNSPAVVGVSATRRSLPVYSVERDGKFVALSFDAAWGNEDTEELIDILTSHGVTATFFLVGQWVDKYPESVKQLSDAGMEVMNHSDDHAHFAKLSASEIVENINACNSKIEAITGVRPTLFRCPYGEYDDNVIDTVNGMGMTAIQWDVDSLDWKGLDAAEITRRVVGGVEPGSIVLFHNAAEHTPEAHRTHFPAAALRRIQHRSHGTHAPGGIEPKKRGRFLPSALWFFSFQLTLYAPRTRRVELAEAVTPEPEPT